MLVSHCLPFVLSDFMLFAQVDPVVLIVLQVSPKFPMFFPLISYVDPVFLPVDPDDDRD